VTDVDARLVAALREQLARRPHGARRVGWKVGRGERERIGRETAVGHLTSATVLEPGSTYVGGGGALHADAELALELGDEQTIAGFAVALELVDLGGGGDASAVVAGNVFHRAVAFGEPQPTLPDGLRAALVVNGEVRASSAVAEDPNATVRTVARLLATVEEQLLAGDRLISGSIVQVPVAPGDVVVADLGALGSVELAVA
jgi:2-keto-4-pentenoate hydratase